MSEALQRRPSTLSPIPAAIPLCALFVTFWVALAAIQRIDVTWHFWVGGALNLTAATLLALAGDRALTKAFFVVSLFVSFLLIGLALRLPLPEELPVEGQETFEEQSPEYL